jgi:hypothetical protein
MPTYKMSSTPLPQSVASTDTALDSRLGLEVHCSDLVAIIWAPGYFVFRIRLAIVAGFLLRSLLGTLVERSTTLTARHQRLAGMVFSETVEEVQCRGGQRRKTTWKTDRPKEKKAFVGL